MINRNEAHGIITRTAIGIKGKARVGEAGIEKTQTAEVSETAFEEHELTELPHCQCGAVLRTIEEIGATDCCSNDLLCIECSKVKCDHCHKSTGVESRIQIGEVYCKRCAVKLGIFILVSFIAVITVVCLILFS